MLAIFTWINRIGRMNTPGKYDCEKSILFILNIHVK